MQKRLLLVLFASCPARADDQSVLPYEHNGGEFLLDYQFSSEGKLDSVGFLLFLDGKPQVCKVNDTGAENAYLHCFQTSEKHEEKFPFVFIPDTGEKGDTLNMTVMGVTRPDFQLDMKETYTYENIVAYDFCMEGCERLGEKKACFTQFYRW